MIKRFKFLSKTEFKMKNLNRGTGNKKMRENRRVNIFSHYKNRLDQSSGDCTD